MKIAKYDHRAQEPSSGAKCEGPIMCLSTTYSKNGAGDGPCFLYNNMFKDNSNDVKILTMQSFEYYKCIKGFSPINRLFH